MLEKEVIDFEKSIVVGIVTQNQSEDKLNEYLDELEFLTFTAGGVFHKKWTNQIQKLLLERVNWKKLNITSKTTISQL